MESICTSLGSDRTMSRMLLAITSNLFMNSSENTSQCGISAQNLQLYGVSFFFFLCLLFSLTNLCSHSGKVLILALIASAMIQSALAAFPSLRSLIVLIFLYMVFRSYIKPHLFRLDNRRLSMVVYSEVAHSIQISSLFDL